MSGPGTREKVLVGHFLSKLLSFYRASRVPELDLGKDLFAHPFITLIPDSLPDFLCYIAYW